MKNIRSILFSIFFLSFTTLFSQVAPIPPFELGNQIGGPTSDKRFTASSSGTITTNEQSSVHYVYNCGNPPTVAYPNPPQSNCPNSTSTQSNTFDNVGNTGADVSYEVLSGKYFEATVWDGDNPSFSLIVSSDHPTTANRQIEANFIVNLKGDYYGTILDPDIVISNKRTANNIMSIFIVYEYIGQGQGSTIAFEQYNYNILTQTISQAIGPNIGPEILTSNSNCSNPNIDINDNNEFIVVYQSPVSSSMNIFSAGGTLINATNTSTYNFSQTRLGTNVGTYTSRHKPDATITNTSAGSAVYVTYYDNNSNLIVYESTFSMLTAGGITFPINEYFNLAISTDNPRITSTDLNCGPNPLVPLYAVTTLDANGDVILVTGFCGGSTNSVNLTFGSTMSGYGCSYGRPVIAFGTDETVIVAWTAENCAAGLRQSNGGPFGNNYRINTVALNYQYNQVSLPPARVPADPLYFMRVDAVECYMDGNHMSIASINSSAITSNNSYTYYSHANLVDGVCMSPTQNGNGLVYKSSKELSQPWLRKKNKLSFKSNEVESALRVFPNPTNHTISIDNNMFIDKIEIITIDGKLAISQSYSKSQIIMDLSNLPTGLYLLKIYSGTEIHQEKLVKQ